ncbi:hypothetical protein NDU88_004992 [Pleurodeles waltl]|uniref:Retrotransposon gag domain-containing protein n=1 Tax=Pleurodeles waltl TaxID=8319 RepID=A0AAV7KZC6_PLEWA|nr:hypothetical protein NDU88_004992 [Pleurodeles waltl]
MPPPPAFSWHFPPNFLLDKAFKDELGQAIEEYFTLNVGTVTKFATVWEAIKAYIQGMTITEHAGVLRSLHTRLHELEAETADLERRLEGGNDESVLSSLRSKLVEFQETAQSKVGHMGKHGVAHVYREGGKPGATLATLLCPTRGNEVILQIQVYAGQVSSGAKPVVERFCGYYTDL